MFSALNTRWRDANVWQPIYQQCLMHTLDAWEHTWCMFFYKPIDAFGHTFKKQKSLRIPFFRPKKSAEKVRKSS